MLYPPRYNIVLFCKKRNGKVEGGEIGDIKSVYSNTASYGWLICDGTDTTGTDYELQTVSPVLYAMLGNSNVLPDLRECVLVGTGTNTTHSIANHDTYQVGQFKDDQMQTHQHTHNLGCDSSNGSDWSYRTGVSSYWINNQNTGNNNGRTGNTTHGKQIGVLYCIKYL